MLVILLILTPITYGCNGGNEESLLLGSPISIYIADGGYQEGSKKDRKLKGELYDLARSFNGVFSVEENSEISAYNTVNGSSTIKISEDLYNVLTTFKSLYIETDGAVNPQVKPLVDLWGFSKRYKEEGYYPITPYDRERLSDGGFLPPDDKYLSAFTQLADFAQTEVYKEGDFYIKKPELSVTVDGVIYYTALDLASAVKGYYLDKAVNLLGGYGIKEYFISAGGSSIYLAGKVWDLQIIDPFSDNRKGLISVPVKDKYASTSGTYENDYTVNGVTYSHIIDGKTGRPTESDVVSATVIGDSGILTDVLSTALVNMGAEKAASYMEKYSGYDYVLIKKDGSLISSIDNVTYL